MTLYELDLDPASNPSGANENAVTLNYIEVIETVIASLQQDDSAMVSQGDDGHLWKFKYGSVEVFVQLPGTSEEEILTVWSTILKLPVQNEAGLLHKLMEMNWNSTFEARFAISENQVVICSRRTLAELSPSEISRNITIVATLADEHDEALQGEFGGA